VLKLIWTIPAMLLTLDFDVKTQCLSSFGQFQRCSRYSTLT
jgi:hypothetical protein